MVPYVIRLPVLPFLLQELAHQITLQRRGLVQELQINQLQVPEQPQSQCSLELQMQEPVRDCQIIHLPLVLEQLQMPRQLPVLRMQVLPWLQLVLQIHQNLWMGGVLRQMY